MENKHDRQLDLIRKKNNVEKIKLIYSSYMYIDHRYAYWWRDTEVDFPLINFYIGKCSSYHKRTRTLNEKKSLDVALSQEDIEGFDLVRGRRRQLPDKWDARPNLAFVQYKSWKHHSKRRKQWISK